MAKSLHVSVADSVFLAIQENITTKKIKNRSEYVEELIRLGLEKEKEKG